MFITNEKLKSCSFAVVDGGWSSWRKVSGCTVTCGGGNQTLLRTCNNPYPKHGGQSCPGPDRDVQSCNVQACPGGCHITRFKLRMAGLWGEGREWKTKQNRNEQQFLETAGSVALCPNFIVLFYLYSVVLFFMLLSIWNPGTGLSMIKS